MRDITEQLSEYVVLGTTTEAVHNPAATFCVIAPGQITVGFTLSVTVTVKLQFAGFPAASLAVYVTVVIPGLKLKVPTWLIPTGPELATVAPNITHVSEVTEQLSEYVAFGTITEALHAPAPVF